MFDKKTMQVGITVLLFLLAVGYFTVSSTISSEGRGSLLHEIAMHVVADMGDSAIRVVKVRDVEIYEIHLEASETICEELSFMQCVNEFSIKIQGSLCSYEARDDFKFKTVNVFFKFDRSSSKGYLFNKSFRIDCLVDSVG